MKKIFWVLSFLLILLGLASILLIGMGTNSNFINNPRLDTFLFLSLTEQLKKEYVSSMGDPFFISGPVDPHSGQYLGIFAILSKLINIDAIKLIIPFGLFNFVLIFISLFLFIRELYSPKESLIITPFVFLLWGAFKILFVGIPSMIDLIYTGFYPATFGFALIFLGLWAVSKYHTSNSFYFVLILFVISLTAFISHIVSGIILFILLIIFALSKFKENKKLLGRIFIVIGLTIVLSAAWPLYNPLSVLKQNQLVNTAPFELKTDFLFSLDNWLEIAGPFFLIGAIFLLKEEKFLMLSVILLFLISVSYLSPIRISLLWRFFPMMIVLLNIVLVRNLIIKNRNILLLFLVIVLGFLFLGSRYVSVTSASFSVEQYSSLPNLGNVTVISDPLTSYHISALKKCPVFSVPLNHINGNNEDSSYQRYYDSYDLLVSHNLSLKTLKTKYGENDFAIVINKKYFSDSYLFNEKIDIPRLEYFLKSYTKTENEYFFIYQNIEQ